jgi:hypothetical protein
MLIASFPDQVPIHAAASCDLHTVVESVAAPYFYSELPFPSSLVSVVLAHTLVSLALLDTRAVVVTESLDAVTGLYREVEHGRRES